MSKLVYLSGLSGNELQEVTKQVESIVETMQTMPNLPVYRLEMALAKTVLTFLDDSDSRAMVIENAAGKSDLYADYYKSLLESLGSLPTIIGRSNLISTDLLAPGITVPKKTALAPEPQPFQPNDQATRALFESWQNWYVRNAGREELQTLTFHQAVFLPVVEGFSQISSDNPHNQKEDYRSLYTGFHQHAESPIKADMIRLGFQDFSNPNTKTTVTNPPNTNMSIPQSAVAPAEAAAPASAPAAPGPNDAAGSLAKVWAEHKTIILIALAILLIGGGAMMFWPKKKRKKRKLNGLAGRKRTATRKKTTASSTRKRKRKPRKRLSGTAPLMLAAPSLPVSLAGTPKKKRKRSTKKSKVYTSMTRAKAMGTKSQKRTKARK